MIIRYLRGFSALCLFVILIGGIAGPQLYAYIAWDRIFRTSGAARRRRIGRWQSAWAAISYAGVKALLGLRDEWVLPVPPATGRRPLLVIANHQSSFDILLLKVLLRKMGYDDNRWIIKRQALDFPVIGRSCKETGCAGVRRSGEKSDLKRVARCAALADRDSANVILFPEGTRFITPRRGSGFENVLPPKIGGFAELRRTLPDFPVLSVVIRWERKALRKTMFDVVGYVGGGVRVEARIHDSIEEQPEEWLLSEWRRIDGSLSAGGRR